MPPSTASQAGEPHAVASSSSSSTVSNGKSDAVSSSALSRHDMARKRKRVSLSCAECRRLKLKCSRISWPCTSCVKRGCKELCPNGTQAPSGRTTKTIGERNAFARRVELLEQLMRDNGLGGMIPEVSPEVAAKMSALTHESSMDDLIEDDDEDSIAVEGDDLDSAGLLVQGVGSLTLREDGTARYLGISAGSAYFADDMGDASETDDDEEEELPHSGSAGNPTPDATSTVSSPHVFPFSISPASGKSSLESLRGALPVFREALRLSNNYYQGVSFMFEPIAPDDYWSDYLDSAYNKSSADGSKLACVFMVLSLGSLFDSQMPATSNSVSTHYFNLAQTALSASRFLSNATLPALQALHLCGNVLFNRHNMQESGETFFPMLGMAVKMAVSMGLHRDGAPWGLTEQECNRRRLAFWELVALDRLQALISGRPYSLHVNHFDTLMPTNASPYALTKWKLTDLIARMTDEVFSPNPPTHGQVAALDHDLRVMYQESPSSTRCSALLEDAFSLTPSQRPIKTPMKTDGAAPTPEQMKSAMELHTLAMFFTESLLYLHKTSFAQALADYPNEPLEAPWAASVSAVSLEAGPYVMRIARSWCELDPVLAPRWWHIFFHTFAATVAQSSLVIKCPTSMLVQHACEQIEIAVDIFETAAATGAPVTMLLPRAKSLRVDAFRAIEASRKVPVGLGVLQSTVSSPTGADDSPSLDMLGTSTQLSRKHPRASIDSGSRMTTDSDPSYAQPGRSAEPTAREQHASVSNFYAPSAPQPPHQVYGLVPSAQARSSSSSFDLSSPNNAYLLPRTVPYASSPTTFIPHYRVAGTSQYTIPTSSSSSPAASFSDASSTRSHHPPYPPQSSEASPLTHPVQSSYTFTPSSGAHYADPTSMNGHHQRQRSGAWAPPTPLSNGIDVDYSPRSSISSAPAPAPMIVPPSHSNDPGFEVMAEAMRQRAAEISRSVVRTQMVDVASGTAGPAQTQTHTTTMMANAQMGDGVGLGMGIGIMMDNAGNMGGPWSFWGDLLPPSNHDMQ